MPLAEANSSAGVSLGRTSAYTPRSLTLRAIRWQYCPPASKTIICAVGFKLRWYQSGSLLDVAASNLGPYHVARGWGVGSPRIGRCALCLALHSLAFFTRRLLVFGPLAGGFGLDRFRGRDAAHPVARDGLHFLAESKRLL